MATDIKILIFLLLANFLPPFAKVIMGNRFDAPLDGGSVWTDGRRILGSHKTIRGCLFSLIGCALVSPLFGFSIHIGLSASVLVLTGDLLTSFIKRRLDHEPGRVDLVLDQFLEGFLPTIFIIHQQNLSWWRVASIMLLFIPLTYLGSRFWYFLHYKKPLKNIPRLIRSSTRFKEWRSCHLPLARWQAFFNFENFFYFRILITCFFKGIGLYTKGMKNALEIEITEETMHDPSLPSVFDGFRIMFFSDLHLDGNPKLTDVIIERIKDIDVDLCLIGGDFRMEMYGAIAPALRQLKHLTPYIRSTNGILGVLGNHDCIEMLPELEDAGIILLVNDSWFVERKGERIWITGIDDPHYYKTHDLAMAFKNVPEDGFVIFLSHSPEAYEEAAPYKPELYLCGHTHGGQICLPGRGPIFTHSRAPYFTASGRWKHKGMTGYTTRGVGSAGIPVRFNCPGEIVLLTLKKGEGVR